VNTVVRNGNEQEREDMSVKIRLSRIGKVSHPYWRIVAVDARKKRDGEHLEDLGTYCGRSGLILAIYPERIQEWLGHGAECTPTVKRIIRLANKQAKQNVVVS